MKNLLKVAGITIALTAIGVAVRAIIKKQNSEIAISNAQTAQDTAINGIDKAIRKSEFKSLSNSL